VLSIAYFKIIFKNVKYSSGPKDQGKKWLRNAEDEARGAKLWQEEAGRAASKAQEVSKCAGFSRA